MTVYEDFTAGIATQAPRLVASRSKKYAGLSGAKTALNVVLDEQGVRTAPGYARIHAGTLPAAVRGLHYYIQRGAATVEELLAVANGNLYADTTITWVSRGSGLADTPKTRFVNFNGYAVFSNGVDPVKQYDGATVANVAFTNAALAPVPAIWPVDNRPTYMFVHQNRIFYLNSAPYPYRLWTPDAGTHNIFDANSDVIDIDLGDGSPLVAGASLTTGIAVLFKTQSIHLLSGTNPTDALVAPFTIRPYSRELGCIAPDTVVTVGSEVYFLSQRGFKRLSYVTVTGDIRDADPLDPARPILDTLDMTRVTQASAEFNPVERCIYLSIPVKGGGWTTLVYNVMTKGIMQRSGFDITNQVYVQEKTTHYFSRVETGAPPVHRVYKNGVGNTYDGAPFASEWESLLQGTDQMNVLKVFSKFLAYTRVYNGIQVNAGIRVVNVDGTITTRVLNFGDTLGVDGWDVGAWDVALWDNAIANVLRQSDVGRGVAIAIFFKASAGAAFFFDRIELDIEPRVIARR